MARPCMLTQVMINIYMQMIWDDESHLCGLMMTDCTTMLLHDAAMPPNAVVPLLGYCSESPPQQPKCVMLLLRSASIEA